MNGSAAPSRPGALICPPRESGRLRCSPYGTARYEFCKTLRATRSHRSSWK